MRGCLLLACVILAAGTSGCGMMKGRKKEKPEQLDPYRSPMADRINAVLYPGRKPAKMLEELALLGVTPGKSFQDFKEETKIDDWFDDESEAGPVRYTSLTCGLSPVVDEKGKLLRFYRNRKHVNEETYPELFIGPGKE
ncbi:hypothetical protein [Luteolibacter sp. Populi]|uniref:hypothetical protein n=1 Tax=Luteolibacter sp. Populi TaxID=3230487 RepID=UPI0034671351